MPLLPASAERAEPLERGAELLDLPAPLSHGALDAALPGWLLARLPAWMRGAPEHGPPEEQEAQAAPSAGSGGAAQEDSSEELPEWGRRGRSGQALRRGPESA